MKAEYNGVKLEGTPDEIAKVIELVGKREAAKNEKPLCGDSVLRQWMEAEAKRRAQQQNEQAYNSLYQSQQLTKAQIEDLPWFVFYTI